MNASARGGSSPEVGRLRGADAVVRALEDEGVPFAFGIPGTHNIELYDRLDASDRVRPILVTDEQSASFMADGLWRATGLLGCVNVVPGAGFTHAISGIAEAYLDHVPMIVVGCGIRRDTGHAFQLHDVDQLAMARPITKGVFRPGRGTDIYPTVRRACALARSGAPGPVMVEIPANLYLRPGHSPAEACIVEGRPPDPTREPTEDDVVALVEALRGSRRTLVYAGAGAARAGPHLVELAELLEAPVASTLQGKGVFPETHPLFLWPGFGPAAPPFARRIASQCDATLAIGCRFGEVGTGSYGAVPPAPLLHVDIDPAAIGRNYAAAIAVVADAGPLVAALVGALARERHPVSRGPDAELRRQIREGRDGVRIEQREPTGRGGVTPCLLLEALQAALGPETTFVTDSGNGTFVAAECLTLASAERFLAPVDYSCMGYSVPAAIGAALGRRGAPVVALVGDGALLMTGLEMLTAAHTDLPVAFVVLRDRELAQIAQFQGTAYNRRVCSALPDYDFPSVCQGVGIPCVRLDTDEGIERAVEGVAAKLTNGHPAALEVAVDYSRKTWFTRGVVRTNLGRLPWPDRLRMVNRALVRRITG